jgi:hypothetical protein
MSNNMSASSVEQLQEDVYTALQCLEEAEQYKERTHLTMQALEDENQELVDEVQDMLDEEEQMQTHIRTMAVQNARLKLQNTCLQEERDALTDRLLGDETDLNTKYSQAELELKIEQARTEERSKIVSIVGEQQRAHDTIQTLQMEKDQMQVELERLMHAHPQPNYIRSVSSASTLFTSFTTSSRRSSSHSSIVTTPSDGNSHAASATFSWLSHAMDHLLARDNAEPNMQHVSLLPKEPPSARGAGGNVLPSRRLVSMSHTSSFEKKKKSSSSFLQDVELECDFLEPGVRRSSSLESSLFKHIEQFVDHAEPSTLVRKVKDHTSHSTFGQLSTSIQIEDDGDGSTCVSNSGGEWPFDLTIETPKADKKKLVLSSQSRIIKKQPKLHQ